MTEEFIEVTTVENIPKGVGKSFEVKNKRIAIFNIDGEFYALDSTCPHAGANLCNGDLSGSIVTCPLHAWEFNVKTGKCPLADEIKVSTYKIKVEGNKILVCLQ